MADTTRANAAARPVIDHFHRKNKYIEAERQQIDEILHLLEQPYPVKHHLELQHMLGCSKFEEALALKLSIEVPCAPAMALHQAKVKAVLSGDTVVLCNINNPSQERVLSLAYVNAPRLRRDGDEVGRSMDNHAVERANHML